MSDPLASCVMPVSPGRRGLALTSLACYRSQRWRERELLVADRHGVLDGVELLPGERRVAAASGDHATQLRALFAACRGEVVVRWDDDDWYGPDRIAAQVEVLRRRPEPACAFARNPYVDLRTGERLRSRFRLQGNGYAWWRARQDEVMAGSRDPFVMPGPVAPAQNARGEHLYATVHGGCWLMDRDYPFDPDPGLPVPPAPLLELVGGGFMLPAGYQSQPPAAWTSDPPRLTFQPDAYRLAADLARELGCGTVHDLGVGTCDKVRDLAGLRYVGWDLGPVVNRAAARFGHLDLRPWDVDLAGAPPGLAGCVVACVDVLEHLARPDRVLRGLRACRGALLTTPDRDRPDGVPLGPPRNPCHAREWSADEFLRLVDSYLGRTHHLELGRTRSSSAGDQRWTTVVAARAR